MYPVSHNRETEAEEAAQVLEHFVDGTFQSNAYSSAILEPELTLVAPDYSNVYWHNSSDSQRQAERFALLREIADALPDRDMMCLLHEVFASRCPGPLGNVVHVPAFMQQTERIRGCLDLASSEAQAQALSSTVSMDTLACHLLAVRVSLDQASNQR